MTIPQESNSYPEPLSKSGALNRFKYLEVSPAIGREYSELQLSDILDNDEVIRDLAITASERGVIFFKDQDITPSDLKRLILKFGELTGKPEQCGLYRNPFPGPKVPDIPEANDPEMIVVSNMPQQKPEGAVPASARRFASEGWHSDESYENRPVTYTGFKLAKSPSSGGDTLFVSSYGLYEHLSEPWQKFAESLSATHASKLLKQMKEAGLLQIKEDFERGHPENVGFDFEASHPVVRTNPVTGWKGLFGVGYGLIDGSFDNVTEYESRLLKEYLLHVLTNSSNLQIRRRWDSCNGVAIWDNRAVHHSAVFDVVNEERLLFHVGVVGERPYLDPNSKTRADSLQN